jgi:outer membrane protein OmpA-like peptidoglycan-associated protein
LLSAIRDNRAKQFDDLAVRMKNDPKLRANIITYTDDSRLRTKRALGEKRAKAVWYLQKQGGRFPANRDGYIPQSVGDNKKAA